MQSLLWDVCASIPARPSGAQSALGISAQLFGIKAALAALPGLCAAGTDTPGVVLCTGSAVIAFPYSPNCLPALEPC